MLIEIGKGNSTATCISHQLLRSVESQSVPADSTCCQRLSTAVRPARHFDTESISTAHTLISVQQRRRVVPSVQQVRIANISVMSINLFSSVPKHSIDKARVLRERVEALHKICCCIPVDRASGARVAGLAHPRGVACTCFVVRNRTI